MYLRGMHADQDAAFAVRLYEECLASEFIEYCDCYSSACLRMGECLLNGWGTDRDVDEALRYLEKIEAADEPKGFDGEVIFQQRFARLRDGIEHAMYAGGDEPVPLPPADASSLRERDPEETRRLTAIRTTLEGESKAKTWKLLEEHYRRGIFTPIDEPFAAYCKSRMRHAAREERKSRE
jgi:TPR repeat protein